MDSLFLGAAAGAGASCVCGLWMLRADLRAKPSRKWIRGLLRIAPSTMPAALLEHLRAVTESATVTRVGGLAEMGLFAHSRIYHGYLMQVSNAFGFALWPRALEDARTPGESFQAIGRAWNVLYLAITIAGIGFAAFGAEIIALLTNGKFVAAAPLVPFWIAYLLLQNSGKPASALLYANGAGARSTRLRSATMLGSIAALIALVPHFGVPAAVGVAFAEIIAFRLLVQHAARRIRDVPFQDGWVIAGVLSIVGFSALMELFIPSNWGRFVCFVCAVSGIIFLGRNVLTDGLSVLRQAAQRLRSGV
jgi:O-antigen/teichoic acid export membrane protein